MIVKRNTKKCAVWVGVFFFTLFVGSVELKTISLWDTWKKCMFGQFRFARVKLRHICVYCCCCRSIEMWLISRVNSICFFLCTLLAIALPIANMNSKFEFRTELQYINWKETNPNNSVSAEHVHTQQHGNCNLSVGRSNSARKKAEKTFVAWHPNRERERNRDRVGEWSLAWLQRNNKRSFDQRHSLILQRAAIIKMQSFLRIVYGALFFRFSFIHSISLCHWSTSTKIHSMEMAVNRDGKYVCVSKPVFGFGREKSLCVDFTFSRNENENAFCHIFCDRITTPSQPNKHTHARQQQQLCDVPYFI